MVDRRTFQAELDALRVREKEHTHEGDAIAAARRRLPMVAVDAATPATARAERSALNRIEPRDESFECRSMSHEEG